MCQNIPGLSCHRCLCWTFSVIASAKMGSLNNNSYRSQTFPQIPSFLDCLSHCCLTSGWWVLQEGEMIVTTSNFCIFYQLWDFLKILYSSSVSETQHHVPNFLLICRFLKLLKPGTGFSQIGFCLQLVPSSNVEWKYTSALRKCCHIKSHISAYIGAIVI